MHQTPILCARHVAESGKLSSCPAGCEGRLFEWFDHDAFARALCCSLNDIVRVRIGNPSYTLGVVWPLVAVKDDVAAEVGSCFLDDPKPIVARLEYVRCDLLTDSITCAKVLIDPNHQRCVSHVRPQ